MGYMVYLNLFVSYDSRSSAGAITQVTEALIPVVGSFIGLKVARSWGGLKSRLGRAITLYSLGTLAWGLGVVGWLIYIYGLGRTEVPYPSPADFVFMIAQILWYAGSLTLAGVIGAQYGMKSRGGIVKLVGGSLIGVVLSYLLLVVVARDGQFTTEGFTLRTFFDFYYPIATALSLTLVTVVYILSRKYLGGIYKKSLLVLFTGFIFQFFGDFWYTYATLRDQYYNGHWSDMLFHTSMLTLCLGLLLYDTQRMSRVSSQTPAPAPAPPPTSPAPPAITPPEVAE